MLGGYKSAYENIYTSETEFTAHRVAGSFHWQVKLNQFGFMGVRITPKHRVALLDTGTTSTVMPEAEWR